MATPDPLVDYLYTLAAQEDRASLAALRGALRPGQELAALRFVVPFLRDTRKDGRSLSAAERRRQEDDAILIASLFALHPERGSISLASALRQVFKATDSESIEGRFRALLSADRADLKEHLRHAVSLCAGKTIPIDWADLHGAIRGWDHGDSHARRRWARDFWASQDDSQETSDS